MYSNFLINFWGINLEMPIAWVRYLQVYSNIPIYFTIVSAVRIVGSNHFPFSISENHLKKNDDRCNIGNLPETQVKLKFLSSITAMSVVLPFWFFSQRTVLPFAKLYHNWHKCYERRISWGIGFSADFHIYGLCMLEHPRHGYQICKCCAYIIRLCGASGSENRIRL